MLDVIHDDIGEPAVRDKVVRPLAGLRVAPYYGCQVGAADQGGDSTEYPMKMDNLLEVAGGRGGRLPGQGPLLRRPHDADQRAAGVRAHPPPAAKRQDYHADMILCMCPMCQLNMDGYQARVNGYFNTQFNLPIMYFTQIAGHRLRPRPEEAGFRQGTGRRHARAEGETERKAGGSGSLEGRIGPPYGYERAQET